MSGKRENTEQKDVEDSAANKSATSSAKKQKRGEFIKKHNFSTELQLLDPLLDVNKEGDIPDPLPRSFKDVPPGSVHHFIMDETHYVLFAGTALWEADDDG